MSLHRALRSIFERLQEHERRLAGSQWRGKVKEVDAGRHLVRVLLGKDDDGGEVLSPWLPINQPAGALKLHSMPSVGQTVSIRSEGGDIEQGVAEPFHWTDENPSPSSDAAEHVLTFGDVTITLVSGGLKFQVGDTTVEFTGSKVAITTETLEIDGESVKHNDKNVGHDHIHEGVDSGPDLTGPPH